MMSLQWQLPREVPPDTAQIGQVILRSHNVYRQVGERFHDLLPEESVFAPLYEPTGRGAISPLLLSLVTVFQMLEKVPDRLAAEYVVSRLDWKYALHLSVTYQGFHFSVLSAFRARLLSHQQERLMFEQLLKRLKELGLLKAGGKMRTDSTHVLGLVERLSQLELVTESLRLALQAVQQAAAEWVEVNLPVAFCEAYEQRQQEYGLSQREVQLRLRKAGRDGFWLLGQLEQRGSASLQQLPEVVVLRQVLTQQFPAGPDGPPASKRPSGEGIIESPHEPEARGAMKREQGWVGYRAHVTESCDEGRPHLIVDLQASEAMAQDSGELAVLQARLQAQEVVPSEQQADQGYVNGRNIATSRQRGIELVGPVPADHLDRPGFRQEDFVIDEAAHQVVCPAGQTSSLWSERWGEEGEPATVQVRFAGETCQACKSFGRCTNCRRGRGLELNAYRRELAERRALLQTEAYRQKLRQRAGIEGTISQLVRGHGLRYARYRGLAKVRLQGLFTAVAVNLKRLICWCLPAKSVRSMVKAS